MAEEKKSNLTNRPLQRPGKTAYSCPVVSHKRSSASQQQRQLLYVTKSKMAVRGKFKSANVFPFLVLLNPCPVKFSI